MDPTAARSTDAVALVPKHREKRRSTTLRLSLQTWLFVPQAIFIPSNQRIQISHNVIILWIDLGYDICFARRRSMRHRMMHRDCHAFYENCYSVCCGQYPLAQPFSYTINTALLH